MASFSSSPRSCGCGTARTTSASDRPLFWAILAFSFGYGSFVINKTAPALVEGIAVLLLVVLASCHFPGRGSTETTIDAEREKSAKKFGNKLFMLALIIVRGCHFRSGWDAQRVV
ncbi:Membrane protein [Cutibacterium acnes JCM 18909]|nr:Membrane protein [Cutibacterium acnes JCM 18909]